ncbi:hypothetical protein WJ0W_001741 [Paenibacillus melissococcoides]|uniref:Uncharacterized protein n=1 Tax=Paenibacillus melissococcoides TaxID=2912268 RepID=A0ABM9FZ00_9BACL|nr:MULTISPECIES: hypothetical protein [Paenibacillus]MEB9892822.1 hypothetical protein [Bacillus cereus]CAH8244507.1 hypothetical protein WJ0W_001741 [Paenibacillus melissococcoides]CAH8708187.1 hypothetical protein WDD9_001828 [Paenibacillus melissococcoides]CAH8708894.1 hypothetical protein HTL2_002113 [Paenibacillus melissococcoides]GIO82768.1 hypothetical protein J6TS7_63780 [Paenibacillus dendritiformis]
MCQDTIVRHAGIIPRPAWQLHRDRKAMAQASMMACHLLRWKRFAGRLDTDNRFISGGGTG